MYHNVMTCSCNHCYHGHAKNVYVLVMSVTVNNVINTEGAATEAQQCIPCIVVLHMLLPTL